MSAPATTALRVVVSGFSPPGPADVDAKRARGTALAHSGRAVLSDVRSIDMVTMKR